MHRKPASNSAGQPCCCKETDERGPPSALTLCTTVVTYGAHPSASSRVKTGGEPNPVARTPPQPAAARRAEYEGSQVSTWAARAETPPPRLWPMQ
jgi:hypothetical protein